MANPLKRQKFLLASHDLGEVTVSIYESVSFSGRISTYTVEAVKPNTRRLYCSIHKHFDKASEAFAKQFIKYSELQKAEA